jgi:hypothetical protein
MDQIMPKETYQTRDLYLAAYLCLNNQRLTGMHKEESITHFRYDDQKTLKQLVLDFFSGTARVEPIRYMDSIKRLRRLINEQ